MSNDGGGGSFVRVADVPVRAVDADGNLAAGRAELLVEPTVGADPQVMLSYPHLHVHMYMESIQIINCSQYQYCD